MASTRGLAPFRTVLPNGLVVLAKDTRATPAVTITLALRSGTVYDPPRMPGQAYLLSRVIDRGTAAKSADDIAEALDSRGVSLGVGVTRHTFSVSCTCLAEDFDDLLALMGEMVMTPSIPEAELTARKAETVTAIRQDEDNPAVRAVEALMGLLYGDGHPYGTPQKGSVETIASATREALLSLHRSVFAPSHLVAVIVGAVEPAHAADAVARVFGAWQQPTPSPIAVPAPAAITTRRQSIIPMMNKSQADIAYGFTAIARDDPHYDACVLMNNVLGQYAIGGRLGDSIRERQGMAYYVFSALDANVAPGPLMIRAGVSPANVDRAIASIDAELTRLVADGIAAGELAESRQYLVGSMPRTLETNAGIAAFLQSAEFFGLGLDYDLRLPERLAAVTLDAANDAARRLLDPSRATVVVAGPYEEHPVA